MDESEAYACSCIDLATERARQLCELALNISSARDPKAKRAMQRAMDLLNEGIEASIRPMKKDGKTLVLFQRSEQPDAS